MPPGEPSRVRPVVLWRYRNMPEALIARTKLEAASIDCLLADENVVRLSWFWSDGIGGMRLLAPDTELEDALALLAEPIPPRLLVDGVEGEYIQPECQRCHSLDVSFREWSRICVLLLWLSVPLPLPARQWYCEDCGYKWTGAYD